MHGNETQILQKKLAGLLHNINRTDIYSSLMLITDRPKQKQQKIGNRQ